MARIEKLVEPFLREPPEILFQDIVAVLEAFGHEERPSKVAIGSLSSQVSILLLCQQLKVGG